MYAVCMRAISLQFSGFAGRYANLSQCFGLLNEAWYRAGAGHISCVRGLGIAPPGPSYQRGARVMVTR